MTAPDLSLIQETPIERILEDHLWKEINLLNDKIDQLQEQMYKLSARRDKLLNIATAADLPSGEGWI